MDNDKAVQAYYALGLERDRLDVGLGRVELARTIEIVERTLPDAPATVVDFGGGPGRYVDWLVERGNTVVHRDVVDDHVAQVHERHGSVVDTARGDARLMDLDDDSADAMLLLGPLYHLPLAEDRLQVLSEAARVVRSGGPVYAVAISRWAARVHGILMERVHAGFPDALTLIGEVEKTGNMPALFPGSFSAYTHRPLEFADEVAASSLELDSVVAVEGVAVTMNDLDARMDDADERWVLMDCLRELERVPELAGVGPHLLAIAYSP